MTCGPSQMITRYKWELNREDKIITYPPFGSVPVSTAVMDNTGRTVPLLCR